MAWFLAPVKPGGRITRGLLRVTWLTNLLLPVVVEVDRDLFPIVLNAMGSDLFMSKPAVITVLQFHLQFLPRNVPVRPTVSLTGNHLILPGR